jgi:hypothetical protein
VCSTPGLSRERFAPIARHLKRMAPDGFEDSRVIAETYRLYAETLEGISSPRHSPADARSAGRIRSPSATRLPDAALLHRVAHHYAFEPTASLTARARDRDWTIAGRETLRPLVRAQIRPAGRRRPGRRRTARTGAADRCSSPREAIGSRAAGQRDDPAGEDFADRAPRLGPRPARRGAAPRPSPVPIYTRQRVLMRP